MKPKILKRPFLTLLCLNLLFGVPSLLSQGDDELISEVDALNDFPEEDLGQAQGNPLSLDDLPVDAAPTDQGLLLGEENFLQGDVAAGPASISVTGMDFRQLGDRVRLVVKTDKPADFTTDLRRSRRQSILEIPSAKIDRSFLKRAMDTGQFDGPVALIKAFESRIGQDPSVRVLFQLRSFIEPTVTRQGSNIYVDFPILSAEGTLYKTQSAAADVPELFINMADSRGFKGARMSLRLKDAPMADVLSLISQASGQNFVLAEGGDSKVTLSVRNTPWDQILAIILVNYGLGYQKVGNTYRIAKGDTLQSELDKMVTAKDKERELLPLETRLFALSYTTVDAAKASVESLLKDSKRSSVTTDKRTNSLVVTSIPENLERIERYLRAVDKQTPQVQIEARIVEAFDSLDRKFGQQWTMNGLKFGSFNIASMGTSGPKVSGNTTIQGGPGDFDAFFDALETSSQAKTIAAPKILASNNEEANLFQGSEAVFEGAETRADGTSTTVTNTVEFTLDLKVTPQVTNDGHVLLDINLKRDTIGKEVANAEVARDRRGIKTKMLVKSGDTTVIGGLYIDDDTRSKAGLPFLKDLPLVGWFFTGSLNKKKERRELLMFISPRIVNADSSLLKAASSGSTVKSL